MKKVFEKVKQTHFLIEVFMLYPGVLKLFACDFFQSTKILFGYCNNFILFCFDAVEGTDNEPVNILLVPDKFSSDRSNLCDHMMKICRKIYFYRKDSLISFVSPFITKTPFYIEAYLSIKLSFRQVTCSQYSIENSYQFWQHFCNIYLQEIYDQQIYIDKHFRSFKETLNILYCAPGGPFLDNSNRNYFQGQKKF